MKNSKKSIKVFTIAAAVTIFGIGATFAIQAAGSANSSNVQVANAQAAANQNTAVVEREAQTQAVTVPAIEETESTTEVPVTEAATEAVAAYVQEATQPATEAPTEPEPVALTEDQINSAQAAANASTYASYINQVYELINQERTAVNAGAVSLDSTLTLMANHRAVENAKNNSMTVNEEGHHIRPNGQRASSIAVYYGQYGSFGEDLGRYQTTPSEIVAGWHNSIPHYNCMVSTKYTRVGVGVAQDSEGNYYWTAIFMN